MQITGSRIIEAIGTLFFLPATLLVQGLPPTFHLFANSRESTTLSYLIEVYTFSVRDGERGHFWDTSCRRTTQFEAKSKLGDDTD